MSGNDQRLTYSCKTRYADLKAVIDRLMALVSVLVLSPLFLLIALCVVIDSPGDALFRHARIGKDGRQFIMYKFRSMHVNNDGNKYKAYIRKYVLQNAAYGRDQNGQRVYKMIDDSQVTRLGGLLRKTNLDELPQIFNVLKGEMSFVGPRPDPPFAVEMYEDWHRKRLGIKPGITGLWQVCGRKNLPFEGMVRLDINYIKRQSLALDAKILLLTVGTILKMDGS